MSTTRKEYKREWAYRKRQRIRHKKASEMNAQLDPSDSDSDGGKQLRLVPQHDSSKLCNTLHMPSSSDSASDEKQSLSEDTLSSEEESWGWEAIDSLCDRFSDSDTCDDEVVGISEWKKKIQTWAVDSKITHSQLNTLLPILKEKDSSIPLSAKTLLKTVEVVSEIRSLSGGDYLYFGLTTAIASELSRKDAKLKGTQVELALNVDGVPLFRSSNYSFWPVLGCVINLQPQHVFVVALYGGKNKPSDLNFLKEAVQELNVLLVNGVHVMGKQLGVCLKFCVCDAVARAMIKCVKQCTGYYGCDKCSQKGEYFGRMTYPECKAQLRDNETFRRQSNAEHHNGISPFTALPVDMVKLFPIDYMHQVCLGVMKRLLVCWTTGAKKYKLSASQKLSVNMRLETFRHIVTSDFSRKPRTLSELAHWKATEFRTFLLYSGYFVLHKICNDEILEHFLSLSVALRILVSNRLCCDTILHSLAHELLLYFVSRSAEIYGKEFLVYNVHSLVHLPKEVELFGKLDNTSAFVFENYMQILKKYARSGRNPVLQVSNRLQEQSLYGTPSANSVVAVDSEIQQISCSPPNNSCVLGDNRPCQVITKSDTNVTCMVFSNPETVFSSPFDSTFVGIQKVRISNGHVKQLPLNTCVRKAICYAQYSSDYLVFIELLHTV